MTFRSMALTTNLKRCMWEKLNAQTKYNDDIYNSCHYVSSNVDDRKVKMVQMERHFGGQLEG